MVIGVVGNVPNYKWTDNRHESSGERCVIELFTSGQVFLRPSSDKLSVYRARDLITDYFQSRGSRDLGLQSAVFGKYVRLPIPMMSSIGILMT